MPLLSNTNTFIEKAILKHGNRHDYSLVEYIGAKIKVNIICKIHGVFKQIPNSHLLGFSCIKCCPKKPNMALEKFINKSNIIHNYKYDYNKVLFANQKTKVEIICNNHGIFYQAPTDHLRGVGCPRCQFSKGEQQILIFLENNNINFDSQKRFKDCKNIKPLPFDFYLNDYNVCIEFQGEQHYRSISFYGGDKGLIKIQKRDKIKKEYCINNNISYIEINKDNINEELLKITKLYTK